MSFPKNFSDQLIIVVLGKSEKFLSGKQLHDYARGHHVCSEDSLPSVQAFYIALKRLLDLKLIKNNSISKKRNFNEALWELTEEGKKVYENICNIYSLIGYVPDWFEINTNCFKCTKNKKECFNEFKTDLENVLKISYNKDLELTNWKVNDLFKSPKNLQEFIFWLTMLKESKRQLAKFENQVKDLGIILE